MEDLKEIIEALNEMANQKISIIVTNPKEHYDRGYAQGKKDLAAVLSVQLQEVMQRYE